MKLNRTSLKDRIAALQQKTNTPGSTQNNSNRNITPGSGGRIVDKIASFEKKGGAPPVPRGSFGLGPAPTSGRPAGRDFYGNRFASTPLPIPAAAPGQSLSIRAMNDSPRRERR